MMSVQPLETFDNKLIDGVAHFLKDLSRNRFFGVLEIQFVDGQIAVVRKEETFKPVVFLVK